MSHPTNSTTICVTLPDEVLAIARNLAQLENLTFDQLLSRAVKDYQHEYVKASHLFDPSVPKLFNL